VLPESAFQAKAILECFNPGMQGGTALAEILFGDVNPSGKLTISYPRHVGQQPIFYSQVRGQHGDRYADLTQAALYPFGHGLSYTRFRYEKLHVRTPLLCEGQALELEVDLVNEGEREGTEVAQVYVSDLVTSVTWVDKKLVGFERVTLKPGEKRSLRLFIPFERLALVNAFEKTLVEPGEFEILVGGSSQHSTLLRGKLRVEGDSFSLDWIPGAAR